MAVCGAARRGSAVQSRFDLPSASPRPLQHALVEEAAATDGPALYIVEAPMGVGKTEAALLAAERLAEKFDLGGCFVALPTMATTDAMFGRVRSWVDRLGIGPSSVFLAHGKAALNREYRELIRRSTMHVGDGSTKDDAGVAVALEWLSGRKKGVLSDFVVGTVDQILMAGLRSRHLMLRHLALAGKVVIIDEVHSSDDFMGVYLGKVLHWLAGYRIPVILLSATLSAARRFELADQYRSGAGAPSSGPDDGISCYPSITVVDANGTRTRGVDDGRAAMDVDLEFVADDEATLVSILQSAAGGGGVIAIVRNTVGRAQRTAQLCREHFGPDAVTLLHSRFVAVDRLAREAALRAELGPPDRSRRSPGLRIVVGTQVLEQSLDVDFDLLITDLAPVDLILQRVGRLHRHRDRPRGERGAMVVPRCLIVGADWASDPPGLDRGSRHVYGASGLLRAAWVLRQRGEWGPLRLPADIPELVDAAADPALLVSESWRAPLALADEEAAANRAARVAEAEQFALARAGRTVFGWTTGSVGDAERPQNRSRVRDGEDSIEVLVGQRIKGRYFLLPWLAEYGGTEVFLDQEPRWSVARALAECSLRLPASLGKWRADRAISELERDGSAVWQRSPWLRGELILWLDENLAASLADVRLTYSRDDGLMTHVEG